MSALEKFKRRLVRDIARRQYVEGQPEDEMWDQLKTEYGCDCFLLWQHMKVLTSKKLKRMLAAEDRMECITRVARMTSTDWLTFDLVLVHQDVDVIGEELIQSGKPESSVLEQLFELVVMYNIENSSEETLVVRWASLTQMYNTGGRACSGMLLQRRWYQLKDLSRRRFYDFWKMYRGNPRNLPKAVRPTKLQIRICEKFPKLITERLVLWKDLLDSGTIVKAAQFESRRRRMESNANNDDPDLVVIEPHVETIEVNADSEDENVFAKGIKDTEINENTQDSITQQAMEVDKQLKDISKTAKNSPGPIEMSNVKVKTEPTEVFELNDTLSDDEPMEIDHIGDTEENIAPEYVENDSKCSINDTVLPKITNIMGNVNIESNEKCNTINDEIVDEISDFEDSQIESDVAPTVICEDSNTLEGNVQQKLSFSSEDVIDMNELPPTLEFVDDGIEFVDDEEDSPEVEKPGDDRDEFVNLDEVDPSYNIDRKLLMIPICYTKKLDDMNILKNSYSTVKGNYLIELIEAESRTVIMNAVEMKTEVKAESDQTDETANTLNSKATEVHVTDPDKQINKEKEQDFSQLNEETETKKAVGIKVKTEIEPINETRNEDDLEKCEVPRVKYTSWLLQKPKHRNYNSIQLCKNPDFNTRLKRLSVGFFLSERNRRLFNACKPLTIDMHKAFETKLVNNVLYLENTTLPTVKQEKVAQEKVATECESTVSVIPSAVAVQSLLDISRVESTHKDDLPDKLEISESKPSPGHISERKDDHVIERGHVVNNPLISPTQSANEDLLRAEVSPVAPTPVSENRPPAQLKETSLNTSHNPAHDKKNKKAKPKPPPSMPQWSKAWTNHVQYEESLITKDTLDKVIFLLDTGIFQLPRKVPLPEAAKGPTTKVAIPPLTATKATTDQETVTNTGEAKNLSAYEDEFIKAQNLISENLKTSCSIRKRNKHRRTIAAGSGFCCWSRHKIEYMRPENQDVNSIKSKKYRHLCPLSDYECYCCCLQDLRNTRRKSVDHTYSRDAEPPPKVQDTRVIVIRDVSIQAKPIRNEYGEVEIKSTIELYHPQHKTISKTEQGAAALDAVGNDSNKSATDPVRTYSVSHSSVSTQSENNDVIVKQLTHASNTSDISIDTEIQTTHEETPPVIKTNVIPAHRGNKAELFSVTASAGWPTTSSIKTNKKYIQKATSLNQQQYIAETISLIEEETDAHPHQTSFSPPKGLLPQGVNILLLPDNTLSVSIEPGVQIDPASLSKLPEILSAVQNKLLASGVLKPCKIPIKRWKYPIRKNTEINNTRRNAVVNQPTIINLDPQISIVHGNVEVNAVNSDIDILQENGEFELNTEVNVTEGNAELTALSPEVQVTEESAQLRIWTPEEEVKENSELNHVCTKVLVTEENAELIAMNPKVSLAKENTELNPVSPNVDVTEDTAELSVIYPDLPAAEERTKLDLMNHEFHFSEDTAELIVMNAAKGNDDLHNMNSDENVTEKNAQLNPVQNVGTGDAEVNSELVANSGRVIVNVVNAEVSVSQENTGLLQDFNTNLDLNTAQTNTMLNLDSSKLEPKSVSTGENIGKGNEDTPIYTDYIVKVAPEANRKTILSDLMTMSGISPEDTNTTTEYPVVNNIIDNNVLNYNLPDNPYYLTNTHNIGGNIQILPPPKKVKKVMVFIKKKIKNKPSPDGSVIDLTDDNDKPVDTSNQSEPQIDNIQNQGNNSNKVLNLKKAKLIRVPAAAVPLKIFQAAQSLLKKDISDTSYNTNMSSTDIEKQMKIHVARHYRQLNRKPTILDILRNIKKSKALQANEKIASESESSDDEPLAKKSRRMRIENSDSNDSNAVVPVEQYNLPVECHTKEQEPMLVSAADDEDSHTDSDTNTDAEESSILGI